MEQNTDHSSKTINKTGSINSDASRKVSRRKLSIDSTECLTDLGATKIPEQNFKQLSRTDSTFSLESSKSTTALVPISPIESASMVARQVPQGRPRSAISISSNCRRSPPYTSVLNKDRRPPSGNSVRFKDEEIVPLHNRFHKDSPTKQGRLKSALPASAHTLDSIGYSSSRICSSQGVTRSTNSPESGSMRDELIEDDSDSGRSSRFSKYEESLLLSENESDHSKSQTTNYFSRFGRTLSRSKIISCEETKDGLIIHKESPTPLKNLSRLDNDQTHEYRIPKSESLLISQVENMKLNPINVKNNTTPSTNTSPAHNSKENFKTKDLCQDKTNYDNEKAIKQNVDTQSQNDISNICHIDSKRDVSQGNNVSQINANNSSCVMKNDESFTPKSADDTGDQVAHKIGMNVDVIEPDICREVNSDKCEFERNTKQSEIVRGIDCRGKIDFVQNTGNNTEPDANLKCIPLRNTENETRMHEFQRCNKHLQTEQQNEDQGISPVNNNHSEPEPSTSYLAVPESHTMVDTTESDQGAYSSSSTSGRLNRKSQLQRRKRRKRIYATDIYANDGEMEREGYLQRSSREDLEKRKCRSQKLKRSMSEIAQADIDKFNERYWNSSREVTEKCNSDMKTSNDKSSELKHKVSMLLEVSREATGKSLSESEDMFSSQEQNNSEKDKLRHKRKNLKDLYKELRNVRRAIAEMYASSPENESLDLRQDPCEIENCESAINSNKKRTINKNTKENNFPDESKVLDAPSRIEEKNKTSPVQINPPERCNTSDYNVQNSDEKVVNSEIDGGRVLNNDKDNIKDKNNESSVTVNEIGLMSQDKRSNSNEIDLSTASTTNCNDGDTGESESILRANRDAENVTVNISHQKSDPLGENCCSTNYTDCENTSVADISGDKEEKHEEIQNHIAVTDDYKLVNDEIKSSEESQNYSNSSETENCIERDIEKVKTSEKTSINLIPTDSESMKADDKDSLLEEKSVQETATEDENITMSENQKGKEAGDLQCCVKITDGDDDITTRVITDEEKAPVYETLSSVSKEENKVKMESGSEEEVNAIKISVSNVNNIDNDDVAKETEIDQRNENGEEDEIPCSNVNNDDVGNVVKEAEIDQRNDNEEEDEIPCSKVNNNDVGKSDKQTEIAKRYENGEEDEIPCTNCNTINNGNVDKKAELDQRKENGEDDISFRENAVDNDSITSGERNPSENGKATDTTDYLDDDDDDKSTAVEAKATTDCSEDADDDKSAVVEAKASDKSDIELTKSESIKQSENTSDIKHVCRHTHDNNPTNTYLKEEDSTVDVTNVIENNASLKEGQSPKDPESALDQIDGHEPDGSIEKEDCIYYSEDKTMYTEPDDILSDADSILDQHLNDFDEHKGTQKLKAEDLVTTIDDDGIDITYDKPEQRKYKREFRSIGEDQDEIICILYCDTGQREIIDFITTLRCDIVEPISAPRVTDVYEMLLGQFVKLSSNRNNEGHSQGCQITIRLPFMKSAMKYYHKPVLRKLENNMWIDISSIEFIFEDDEGCITPVLEATINGVSTFAIVACPITEHFVFSETVKSVSSVIDNDIILTSSFSPRFDTHQTVADMRVLPLERSLIDDSKSSHVDDACLLVTTGPLVQIDLRNDPPQPVTLYLPCHKPKSRPWTAQMSSRLSTDSGFSSSRIKSRAKSKESINNFMECWYTADNYLVRYGGGIITMRKQLLKHRDITKNEKVVLTVHEKTSTYMIIETKKEARTPDVESIVGNLLKMMEHHRVYVCVLQRKDNRNQLRVSCIAKTKFSSRLASRLEHEYNAKRHVFSIKEGDVICLSMRGNIAAIPNVKRFFRFYAVHGIKLDWQIEILNRYSQRSLPEYCGFVQVFVRKDESFLNYEDYDKIGDESAWKLLAEIPVTLPKKSLSNESMIRAPLLLKDQGPVTIEFLKSLARFIGPEWYNFARALTLEHVRIQSIIQQNRHVVSTAFVTDLLITWLKRSQHGKDKAKHLIRALRKCGRNDLAVEVEEIDNSYKNESYNSVYEIYLDKAVESVRTSVVVIRIWRELARALGLPPDVIGDIDSSDNDDRWKCSKMLAFWRKDGIQNGSKTLIRSLRQIGCYYVADHLSIITGYRPKMWTIKDTIHKRLLTQKS